MSCCIKRVISITEAIQHSSIDIIDESNENITVDCKFAWSCDGVSYTDYYEYDDFYDLTSTLDTDFYVKVLFCGNLSKIFINCQELDTGGYSLSIYEDGFLNADFCNDPNLFDPYADLECALLLQQQLADMVICMFGIPIYYFRVDPDLSSRDLTFKEFTLHSVVDCKQIKLMLNDGQMPSSNPRTTEFDFDWETDWETELSKTQFANAFGDTVYPKYGDFLYVPMMNRMWNVNAAYDEKQDGLMWHSTTWKLSLVKYEDFKNIDKGDWEGVIDGFLNKTYANTFAGEERNEQVRQSGVLQTTAPIYAATNLYNCFREDAVRKQLTFDDIKVLEHMICNGNTVVVRNMYDFLNSNGTVVYQEGICGDSGTVSFIFEVMPGTLNLIGEEQRSIMDFGALMFHLYKKENSLYVECNELELEVKEGFTYILVYKYAKSNYLRKMCLYQHKPTHADIPLFKLKQHPKMFAFDFDNPSSTSSQYYEDDEMSEGVYMCQVHGWPLRMSNIKYYNVCLGDEELIPELCKYTTTHDSIIINDLARPLNSGRGYSVR